MSENLKIRIELHEGENTTVKIWRFNTILLNDYTVKRVEDEIVLLFPHISAKSMKVKLYHVDDLAGKVDIESDIDMIEALNNFKEEYNGEKRKQYLTLHAEDDLKPSTSFRSEDGCKESSKSCRKRKRPLDLDGSVDLELILGRCQMELDVSQQPLYIDEALETILCQWCPSWKGSIEVKVINQHVRKAVSHNQARKKALNIDSQETTETTTANLVHESTSQSTGYEHVPCQGIYDRKYASLYNDRTLGCTTAKSLWEDRRSSETNVYACECCQEYKLWKYKHQDLAKQLQKEADLPHCYKYYSNETVSVVSNAKRIQYIGTIRALSGARLGACNGEASTGGPHPYICVPCNALVHGKTSTLNHKLNRSNKLKHPRTDLTRATKKGVNHKFCSTEQLQAALQTRKESEKVKQGKLVALTNAHQKLLQDSWHQHHSAKPFMKMLITLIEENKLSSFDMSFLNNWVGKKSKGRHYRADEQARSLAILYSNKLGEKMYTTTAPLLGLPCARQARKIRASATNTQYLPGLNDWVFSKLSKQKDLRPLQNGMDGTRIIRTIELYLDKYLVGRMFPPDIRLFQRQLIEATSTDQIQEHIIQVRREKAYAAEAYSFNFSDTTGDNADMLVGTIPEATSGVTGDHILAMMFEVDKQVLKHQLPLVGHCTDSAANSLNALIKLASPATYLKTPLITILSFVGLNITNFTFFAPFLRPSYPSIAYPCWDHSGRTVIRNLMNTNITIVSGELQDQKDGIKRYLTATIRDLHTLKNRHTSTSIKHCDITPHVKQNCDATTRVLTSNTVSELAQYVPESKGTQLYLQAAVWTHEPYRNARFGTPPMVARSLWAGLMTWRRWRRYIEISPNLTLTDNFISRAHYMTEELLVHAGINHNLTMFLCFPNLPISKYSLRNTGNRGIEAIHGMFRGGSSSLPITSPNLSFKDFLSRMNKTIQIHEAEHTLRHIEGNTIVATKKKRLTSALQSKDKSSLDTIEAYKKPDSYILFLKELEKACRRGDEDSKNTIANLAPQMEAALKKTDDWDSPSLAIDPPPENLTIVSDCESLQSFTAVDFDAIIDCTLGPLPTMPTETAHSELSNADVNEAYANIITDVPLEEPSKDDYQPTSVNSKSMKKVQTFIKDLQPYREKPSKDRSRRFATGEISFNKSIPSEHNLITYDFWTILPSSKELSSAKVFLLGQILYIAESGKPVTSSIKENPNTNIVLNMFEFEASTSTYVEAGRSGLLKASKHLISNVTIKISGSNRKCFDYNSVSELAGYVPYHNDLDIQERIPLSTSQSQRSGSCTTASQGTETDEEDPFLVENIIAKRFNAHKTQYEYLVKWLGYASTENTWELPSNIPSHVLDSFEQTQIAGSSNSGERRSGLRDRTTRKLKSRPDYIVNA